MGLKFEDPGVRSNAKNDHTNVASELRANPGEWAVVAEDVSPTLAQLIKNGKLVAYRPAGSFESVTRGISNGRAAKVYARYVGEATA